MFLFISGIIFATVVLPLLKNFMTIMAQLTEVICAKLAIFVYQCNKQLEEGEEEEKSNPIGFACSSVPVSAAVQEEEDWDEE